MPGHQAHKARGFVVDSSGRPAAGIALTASVELTDGRRVQLGALASDSAGYVSFDLAEAFSLDRPARVLIEPLGGTAPPVTLTIPEQGAEPGPFTVHVRGAHGPCTGCGVQDSRLPAVQNPDALDWALSPGSLVTPRSATQLGEGDCAVPVRSVLPVRRIGYVQIARRPVTGGDGVRPHGDTSKGGLSPVDGGGEPSLVLEPFAPVTDRRRPRWLPCDIYEYEQSWQDIGETLGSILSSLPLAPCESINVAVIEASRQDLARRTDEVESKEELDHSLYRDRTIDESVEGALKEKQGGWSLMGGHAGSYSGSWANVGTFSAVHSLGGAVSHSYGKRTVTAETTQELHDSTVQATDVVRSLNSTVVVQASQNEQHRAETRTITNHNHCHALTVQYYEVLRQVRLETRLQRSRPGALVPYSLLRFTKSAPTVEQIDDQMGHKIDKVDPPPTVDLLLINRLRPQLQGSLLSPALDVNFDAVRRLLFFSQVLPPQPPALTPGDYEVQALSVKVKRGRWGTGPRSVSLKVRLNQWVGSSNYLTFSASSGLVLRNSNEVILVSEGFKDDLGDDDDTEWLGPWTLPVRGVARKLLAEAELHWTKPAGDLNPDFYLRGLDVRASVQQGEEVLIQEDVDKLFQQEGFQPFTVVAPPAPPADAEKDAAGKAAEQRRQQRAQDEALAWELLTHLHDHRDHYSRGLIATKDPAWFAEALDDACGANTMLRERIDGVPVAVSGQYLVFPLNSDPQQSDSGLGTTKASVSTDVVSLPTRGVFAEAQLGTCNSCEKRDPSRYWKWQQSPCGEPPAIEGVTPGFRGQAPQLGQSQLPNTVVQITQPPSAPDPTGLATALALLGKGDAFRDMSGLSELSELLQGLASGAIDLAKAQALGAKVSQAQAKGGGSGGGGGGSGSSTADGRDLAFEPDAERQIDRLDALDYARDKELIDDQGAREAATSLLGGVLASADDSVLGDAGARPHWNAYVYVVGTDNRGMGDFNAMREKLTAETKFVLPWVNIVFDYKNLVLRKTWKRSANSAARDEEFPLDPARFVLYQELATAAAHATVRHLHFLAHGHWNAVYFTPTMEATTAGLRSAPQEFAAAFADDSVVKVHGCGGDADIHALIGDFCTSGKGANTVVPLLRKHVTSGYSYSLARVIGLPIWGAPPGVGTLYSCTYQRPGERGRQFCVETSTETDVHGYPNTLKFFAANYERFFARTPGEALFDCTYHMKYKPGLAAATQGPATAPPAELPPRGVCGRSAAFP